MDSLRLDKWLCCARFCKTRGIAQKLIEAGLVTINGRLTDKASTPIRAGDEVALPLGRELRRLRVVALALRRGTATEARTLYEEVTSP